METHPLPELGQGKLPLSLSSIPMNTVTSKPLPVQLLCQSVCLVLGSEEHKSLISAQLPQQGDQLRFFVSFADLNMQLQL